MQRVNWLTGSGRRSFSQRWNAIADLVIDRHLAGLMPEGDRPVIREGLANEFRVALARARDVQEHELLDDAAKSQQGFQVGQRAVSELDTELDRLQDGYRNRQRMVARPRTQMSTRTGTPASRLDSGTPGRVDADIEHLRRMMGGGAPAAGAVRVKAGEAARVSYRVAVGRAVSRVRS